jgi:hypothetical protein
MIAVITILLVVGFGAALLGLPVRIFKGRKRDWGEPYYDLDGREWKIYRMPARGDGGGAAGDVGVTGGH